MALLPSGDLLLSTEESVLRTLSAENKLEESKYSVAPLKTTAALHITSDGKIIVGATEDYLYTGERNIIVMNLNGEHIKTYSVDNNKKPLFEAGSIPFKVTSDKSRNIYVIDKQDYSIRNGRLVILSGDDSDEVKCIYKGSESSIRRTFDPTDIVVMESNRVIVCDAASFTLHILNTSGRCLATQSLIKLSIKRTPNCLAIDHRGFVLLGCSGGLNKKNAKLHVIKISTKRHAISNEVHKTAETRDTFAKRLPQAPRHIFLVRHGQYKVQGTTDLDQSLTSLGVRQANLTSKRLQEYGYAYTRLVSSRMARAKDTVCIIMEIIN
ncbi:PGAM5 [Mytilus coruscus]|uniref:Serine/threonine-protein phosphatase PGAM5, mitochondrial n=1 Tax=Mytilus coruscus TaxID=42192 RepID=A0A6J8D135_MYTCO|nr:PGAM5 [Mytilus coruscus]